MQHGRYIRGERAAPVGAVRAFVALVLTAFEALAERRYAAPWRTACHKC